MDDDEREALSAEVLYPDDPALIAALDLARWELSISWTLIAADGVDNWLPWMTQRENDD